MLPAGKGSDANNRVFGHKPVGIAVPFARGLGRRTHISHAQSAGAQIISAEYSDEKTRDLHHEAERVMDLLGIKPGVRVADIGVGRGYYTVRLSARLGPGATIYATDVKADHIKELQARLKSKGIGDVKLVLGSPNDPNLPPAAIDVAILAHVCHEIENPYEFMYRLHRSLALGARVGVVDLDRPTGSHGTPPKLLRCELGALGYREAAFQYLKPADGYLMVFAPPEELPAVESIRACSN